MSLASFTDANTHLDEDKLKFVDDSDAEPEAQEADDVVRGVLAATFPDYVGLWDIDDSVNLPPELVTQAASLLMASYRYAKKYSEESLGINPYAEKLEARAMSLLQGIVDGTYSLWDVSYGDAASDMVEQSDFWPNDSTTVLNEKLEEFYRDPDLAPTTKFRMGKEF